MHPDIKFDFNRMMAESVGPRHGIDLKRLYELEAQTQEVHNGLHAMRGVGQLPFAHLPYDEALLKEVKEAAKKYDGKIKDVVVCGIGGSALGTSSLYSAIRNPEKGRGPIGTLRPQSTIKARRLFICDNVDPESFSGVLKTVHPQKTLFVIVSKSGGTAETLGQFLALQKLKGKRNFLVITDPEKGYLREYVQSNKIPSLEVPPGVGGRYSVFSAVSLFPLAMAGVNVEELLSGARQMDKRCVNEHVWTNPAAMLAQVLYLALREKKKSQVVFMPYSDSLAPVGDWFVQLWDESLGKRYSLKGEEIETGQTAISARGVTDQHSQLQLFMEGPNDKAILFLVVEKWRRDLGMGKREDVRRGTPARRSLGEGGWDVGREREVAFLKGRKMGDLAQIEWMATERGLTEVKRPNLTLFIPEISLHALGQLYQLFMLTTVYMGGLLNVNPFDQPGVELGKKYTREMMKKKEFGTFKHMIKRRGGEEKYWV